jgi:hypothetical protein
VTDHPAAWLYTVSILNMFPSVDCTAQLNEWGRDVWELVTVVTSTDEKGRAWTQAIFKRPRPTGPTSN